MYVYKSLVSCQLESQAQRNSRNLSAMRCQHRCLLPRAKVEQLVVGAAATSSNERREALARSPSSSPLHCASRRSPSRLLQRRTHQPTTQARSQLSLCQGEIFFDHCPRDDAQNRDGGQYKVPAGAVRGVAGKVSVLRQQGEEREAEKSRGDQAQGKET